VESSPFLFSLSLTVTSTFTTNLPSTSQTRTAMQLYLVLALNILCLFVFINKYYSSTTIQLAISRKTALIQCCSPPSRALSALAPTHDSMAISGADEENFRSCPSRGAINDFRPHR
jgi:hypothetical protein